MYYPGHGANGNADRQVPVMQQQNFISSANPGSMNAYGYYQPPRMQQAVHALPPQHAYYGQGLAHPVQHPLQTCSFPQGTALPPMGMFYGAPQAPVLPPLTTEEPAARDEYVNGGVNQFLDYDLDLVADFVVKNAYAAFGTDSNTIIREANSTQTVELFTNGVSSVLNATRLPSVTIFLALDLLNKYISKLPEGCESIGGKSVNVIYQNTMIAFVLANKFNDDKTFTNKSWTQATGMTLSSINDYEREWLQAFEWRLFQDKFVLYEKLVHSFEVFCQEKRCPSPPNLLPTPHTTDNYLSPPSGYQTPVQLKSNVYSSPCYYDEDTNDFCYNHHSKSFRNGSPVDQTASQTGISGMNAGNFNYNYYQYNMQQPQLQQLNMGLIPNRTWNSDDTFHNVPNYAQLGSDYYCYSAVY